MDDYKKYTKIRNTVSTKLKHAEANHNQSRFTQANIDSSDTWKNVKQILGSTRSNFPIQIMAERKLITKPIEMATAVNKFFLEKILKLKESTKLDPENATKELENFLERKELPVRN